MQDEETVKSCIRWTLGSQSQLSEQQLKRCWAQYGREISKQPNMTEGVSYQRFKELVDEYRNGVWK